MTDTEIIFVFIALVIAIVPILLDMAEDDDLEFHNSEVSKT